MSDHRHPFAPERMIGKDAEWSILVNETVRNRTHTTPQRQAEEAKAVSRLLAPLSGRGQPISYVRNGRVRHVRWGSIVFLLPDDLVNAICTHFLRDEDKWYLLGADMVSPPPGGLGDYLRRHSALSPRHASAVAAILVDDGLVDARGRRPIELRKHAMGTRYE